MEKRIKEELIAEQTLIIGDKLRVGNGKENKSGNHCRTDLKTGKKVHGGNGK